MAKPAVLRNQLIDMFQHNPTESFSVGDLHRTFGGNRASYYRAVQSLVLSGFIVDAAPNNRGAACFRLDPVRAAKMTASLFPDPMAVIGSWRLGFHDGSIVQAVASFKLDGNTDHLRKALEHLKVLLGPTE